MNDLLTHGAATSSSKANAPLSTPGSSPGNGLPLTMPPAQASPRNEKTQTTAQGYMSPEEPSLEFDLSTSRKGKSQRAFPGGRATKNVAGSSVAGSSDSDPSGSVPEVLESYRHQVTELSKKWVLPPEFYTKAQLSPPSESLRLCDPVSLPTWEEITQSRALFDLDHPFGQMGLLVVNCTTAHTAEYPAPATTTQTTTAPGPAQSRVISSSENTVFLALRNQEAIGRIDSECGLEVIVSHPVVPTLDLALFHDVLRSKGRRPLWPEATDLLAPFLGSNFDALVDAYQLQQKMGGAGLFA